MIQNQQVENAGPCNSALDQNAKNDLRRNHFNFGNAKPNFETTFRSEYYDKSKMMPQDNLNLKNIEKLLRKNNYEFGDDKPDYITETAFSYQKPEIVPNNKPNTISNQLLQKSNCDFGNKGEPWNSTHNRAYTPKYVENEKNTKDLSKTNFVLGDDKPNLQSVSNQTYVEHPYQYKPVDKKYTNYLRSHHFNLGNNPNNEFQSQNHEDYKDPNSYDNNFPATISDNSLRQSHFSLGDLPPSEIYNTTYKIVHTPKKVDREPNIIRKSALSLLGNNPMDYKTDYTDNYVPKKNDTNKSCNDLVNNIRNSHFNLGDMKNDFSTTNNNSYRAYPNVRRSDNGLGKDMLNYLKGTHYKLGYDDDIGTTTQKSDFIPYELNGANLGRLGNRGDNNLGNKSKFEGVSIYTTDYTKKEIPNDGNDCWC